MNLKLVKKTEDQLEIEVEGEDHSLCNAIRKSLLEDKHVTHASYRIDHPLISNPIITVRTDGKESPEDALRESVKRVGEMASEFRQIFTKAAGKEA